MYEEIVMRHEHLFRFYLADNRSQVSIPWLFSGIYAGFPSPAEDYCESSLDLNEHFVPNPISTYFIRVVGDSMLGAGIHSGDLLIVDRSIEPTSGRIVLAVVDGEFTVKRLIMDKKGVTLLPENPDYTPIEITEDTEFQVWGVVTTVLHEA